MARAEDIMLKNICKQLLQLYSDENGATMVEYAIIACAIAALCVLSVTAIGNKTHSLFIEAESTFP
jgi:Flp pilus assembly pilin Flp